MRLLIRSAEVGRVLGRKGSQANSIRHSSRCKIDLGEPNPLWNGRVITIRAQQSLAFAETFNSAASAVQQIMTLLWPGDAVMFSLLFLVDAS